MKIGVMPSSLKLPFKEAVIFARDLGAKGIQPYVTGSDLSPALSKEDRAAALKYIRDNGLTVSAICVDIGSKYFKETDNTNSIDTVKKMMSMAPDLGTSIASAHIGKIPADPQDPEHQNAIRTIRALADHGREIGVNFAIETGPEMASELKSIIKEADRPNIKVNLDPANFVMVAGQNPVEAVPCLADFIVHTHAKDGIKNINRQSGEPAYYELPLGQGNVPYAEYLAALRDIGYDGFLTIEREAGNDRLGDVKHAYEFRTEHLKKLY